MTTAASHVLVRQHDGLGHITLNRPGEFNALSHAMVLSIRLRLWRWKEDPTVRTVVIDGAGERGLSAGEDVEAIYDDVRSGGNKRLTSGRTNIGSQWRSPTFPSRSWH